MDRRKFTLLTAGALGAPLAALTGCGGGDVEVAQNAAPLAGNALTAVPGAAVVKYAGTPNPTGLRFGFWETFSHQQDTLAFVGRRPSARVGFDNWAAIELSEGVYTWPGSPGNDKKERYTDTHRYGETILAAVNISFAIAAPYRGLTGKVDITDPHVRVAARKFLAAYVKWLMGISGSVVLTIDYEIVSNYGLGKPGSSQKGREWAEWYVEAAAIARQAAAEFCAKNDSKATLQLQPIFNGNPFDPENPISTGGSNPDNQWIHDVVAASDALAFDTYHRDPDRLTGDPTRTLDIIAFWIREFARGGKPVVVTENGFSTALDAGVPPPPPDAPPKYIGTEAQQRAYFNQLLPALLAQNKTGGRFNNQLRGFHIWCITDNEIARDETDRYFGLIDLRGPTPRAKPAAAFVQGHIRSAEADPFHQPYKTAPIDGRNLAEKLANGTALVTMRLNGGDDFEMLRYTDRGPANAKDVQLAVTLATAGCLLLNVNGHWIHAAEATSFHIPISAHYRLGESNQIDVYVTDAVFPVRKQVQSLTVEYITPTIA